MNDIKNKRSIIVGLFVFIGLLFLIGGILMIGNMRETFKKKMTVISLFDNVSGLQAGNNIWFSGVKIGTVSKLLFFGKSQVEVTMKIDIKTQQYIRKDAKVKIGSDGLIGNKILEIYGGTSVSPEVEEGDTLGVEKSFSTDEMISTLQENNKNLLIITNDFKSISQKIAGGEGTIGKLINDNAVYANINAATESLQQASVKASQLVNSLNNFSNGLNTKGTLANELVTDTMVFHSLKGSVHELEQMAGKANNMVADLKQSLQNPNSSLGVLLHDEKTGTHLKETIKNLESSSIKLNDDLEAVQHNFLLRGFFKKRAKEQLRLAAENEPK